MALPATRRRETTRTQPLGPWEPFMELDRLQQQTARLMETVLAGDGTAGIWSPPVDIEETDDAWIVEAELPGAKADNIDVQVHDSEVVVTGEIKERERKGILRRRTRKVGQFEYRVTLPGRVNGDDVDADLDEGVLRITVPKAEEARSRRVEVTSGSGSNGDRAA
jgi:HSP20 family protein